MDELAAKELLAAMWAKHASQIAQWQIEALSGLPAFIRVGLDAAGEVEVVNVHPYLPALAEHPTAEANTDDRSPVC